MIDGQHRLNAIILANVTLRMMVTFGLPSQIEGKPATTMDAVDRGATRTVADQLKIQHGMADGKRIATITATIAALCLGERTRRMSVALTLEVHKIFQEEIAIVLPYQPKSVEARGLRSLAVFGAFALALRISPSQRHSSLSGERKKRE